MNDAALAGAATASIVMLVGVIILAIALFIAPIVIWHHLAYMRYEAKAFHKKALAELSAIKNILAAIGDRITYEESQET